MKNSRGYKDIKFGMSLTEINNLGVCGRIDAVNLSLVGGKCYKKETFFVGEFDKGERFIIKQIIFPVGNYTSTSYDKYHSLLSKKYGLTYEFGETQQKDFNLGNISSLYTAFANGEVILKITTVNKENILYLIYSDDTLAKKMFIEAKPKIISADDI